MQIRKQLARMATHEPVLDAPQLRPETSRNPTSGINAEIQRIHAQAMSTVTKFMAQNSQTKAILKGERAIARLIDLGADAKITAQIADMVVDAYKRHTAFSHPIYGRSRSGLQSLREKEIEAGISVARNALKESMVQSARMGERLTDVHAMIILDRYGDYFHLPISALHQVYEEIMPRQAREAAQNIDLRELHQPAGTASSELSLAIRQ